MSVPPVCTTILNLQSASLPGKNSRASAASFEVGGDIDVGDLGFSDSDSVMPLFENGAGGTGVPESSFWST
jgi:hypothetical protein